MRARGTQLTDLVIIVVAADDDIMPQTKEAISHAQAASVPIVFAINKIDSPNANPDKIKEGLSAMNLLVEDWGKIQSHDVSAKQGTGIPELLEKVMLEAELLELKANPSKAAQGTVVEAFWIGDVGMYLPFSFKRELFELEIIFLRVNTVVR